jgi:lipopolysaccharide transport protein LptA
VALSSYLIPAQLALLGATAALFQVNWSHEKAVRQPPPPPALGTNSNLAPLISTKPPVKAVPVDPVTLQALTVEPVADSPPPTELVSKADEILAQLPTLADEPLPLADPGPPVELSLDPVDVAAYQITADSASNFDMNQKTAVFSGSVELNSRRFNLTANKLTVHMDPKKGKLKQLVANGSVEVHVADADPAKTFHGVATQAEFDPESGIVTLLGWPRIKSQGREHRASDSSTKMLIFTENPRMVTQGRASTLIQGAKALQASE